MISQFPYPRRFPVTLIPTTGIYFRRFGFNMAVGTSFVTIDDIGVATPWMPTVASRVEVLSTSANDTAAGSGARTIELTGLDSNWVLTTEIITLNGVTPVASVGTFYRVTKAEVKTVGSYGASNAGDITTRVISAGANILKVVTGAGQSFSSHFCVPAGYYGSISGANLSTDSGKIVDVKVLARDNANNVVAPFSPLGNAQYFAGVSGTNHYDYEPPILLTPYTDVYLTAKTSTGTASVSVEYWGWIDVI